MGISIIYTTIYWFSFRALYKFIGKRFPGRHQNKKRQVITSISVIVGFFLLQLFLDSFLVSYLKQYLATTNPDFLLKVITSFIFTILILSLYEGIYLSHQVQRTLKENEQMMRENVTSQLAGLKNQVNPHFLFNSLNTLSSLVHEDANRADAFIGKLSKVYRYILDKNDDHTVSLEEEIKYLHSYIHLMKERFGNNIIYTEKIDPSLLHKCIMPFSLQITFENCVKHNIITKEKPLNIHIETSVDSEYLFITNNLQKLTFPEEKSSVGLENIKRRYSFFTAKPVHVLEDETTFKVGLPLLKMEIVQSIYAS
jgi:two-component system, LytTR family, sensor kinase